MTPEEVIKSVKFPNDTFRISTSKTRCLEYVRVLQHLGMLDAEITEMISTLYQDAFNEADYQRAGEKFDANHYKPYQHV